MGRASYDIFERYRGKGMDAYRAGDYPAAREFLLEAARAMAEMAKETEGRLKDVRTETAKKLLKLAHHCKGRRAEPSGPAAAPRGGQYTATSDTDGAPRGDWVLKEKPNVTFKDIAGLEDVREQIALKMVYPFTHPELAARFRIPAGGGVLLYGPPGTGKTMIGKAVANEIDATFYAIKPSQIMRTKVGESEQLIDQLFKDARSQPRCVIFIDELEALVPARREDGSGIMQRIVPQILTELDGVGGKGRGHLLFMGATNKPWQLDTAVMRPGRFDEKIYVPLPDPPARFKMLEMYLAGRPLADDVDFAELTDGLHLRSGADIKAICDKAAAVPFVEAVKGGATRMITRADLLAVIELTPPSVDDKELARFDRFAKTGEFDE
jgi:transitional endoplasmic reticulum ATPase